MYMDRTASERRNEKKKNKLKKKVNSKLPELVDPLNVFDILVFF